MVVIKKSTKKHVKKTAKEKIMEKVKAKSQVRAKIENRQIKKVKKIRKKESSSPATLSKFTLNGKVQAIWNHENVFTENSDEARDLYGRSRYGSVMDDGKVQLSLAEALYLTEKRKITVKDGRGKIINFDNFIKKARKVDPSFWTRYCVFKNIRDRGYIIKTALKFGADFRVYDRGIKPGEDHARWIIYPVNEATAMTWYEFAAKNRVAHSTKKRLMVGIVDNEGDVTYYEIRWMRP